MKSLHKNTEFQLDEILFENRNKAYGAYVLRNQAGSMLTKAMFSGVALFAAVSVTPFLLNSFKTPVIKDSSGQVPVNLKPVDEVPEKIPVVIKPAAPPKAEATVKIEVPTPKKNVTVETPATPLSKTNDAKIGTENMTGDKPAEGYHPVVSQVPQVAPPILVTPKPAPADNSPATKVDVEASFNGGINAFREKVTENFDVSNFEGSGGVMSAVVTFIVEKDGTISNVKAAGKDADFNREAENTIKSVKGRWTPAKIQGQAVRSYFKIPLSMKFE